MGNGLHSSWGAHGAPVAHVGGVGRRGSVYPSSGVSLPNVFPDVGNRMARCWNVPEVAVAGAA